VFVRWASQEREQDDAGRLPGLGDTVVRRFAAPEALNTRFHEVRTKSALNRIPAGARLPFSWTVNPYRGCSHACAYCTAGDTLVMRADGRQVPIADLQVGDAIYGTERRGRYRRYVPTRVLAHWSSVKPAHRVVLADGTELVASGDHRFLSARGWKHVTGAERGLGRRPHLTRDDTLLGLGRVAQPPDDTRDYRQGYLCGLIRGDGHLGAHTYARPERGPGTVHRFGLALADLQALERAHGYLAAAGAATDRFAVQPARDGRRAMQAIRSQRRSTVALIGDLVAWPHAPSTDWTKGFLAGIFDAQGSCAESLRIANCDDTVLARLADGLDRLGFAATVEDRRQPNRLRTVRLLGGTAEQQRFFQTVDPAITRKRSIEGRAVKSAARLDVVAVEPLAIDLPMYDITTGTGDFIANGVISHNCFARPTHEYLDLNAGRDFEREIIVKVNVPEVLRAELARPAWTRERVALGTNTDPYQWVEGRYKLMRGIWEALRDAANPCSILTKSPLVLRDLDLLKQIGAVTEVSACLSVPTLDEKAWRATEPHTPHPRARLEAVAELNRQGIPTGILIAPLMPGINDAPEQVAKIVEIATEAGATYIGGNTLFLRGSTRDVFFDWLREHRPDLVDRYEALYARGAYLRQADRREIEKGAGAPWAGWSYDDRARHRGGPRQGGQAARRGPVAGRAGPPPQAPERAPVQGSLF
jgi:DNA repair photolyase